MDVLLRVRRRVHECHGPSYIFSALADPRQRFPTEGDRPWGGRDMLLHVRRRVHERHGPSYIFSALANPRQRFPTVGDGLRVGVVPNSLWGINYSSALMNSIRELICASVKTPS